ncbi:MAG: hypothetical protein IPG89_15445 [Bacteroidetes bacterium]|nr:hypothetical protein [Bacteroidota bacterium]
MKKVINAQNITDFSTSFYKHYFLKGDTSNSFFEFVNFKYEGTRSCIIKNYGQVTIFLITYISPITDEKEIMFFTYNKAKMELIYFNYGMVNLKKLERGTLEFSFTVRGNEPDITRILYDDKFNQFYFR